MGRFFQGNAAPVVQRRQIIADGRLWRKHRGVWPTSGHTHRPILHTLPRFARIGTANVKPRPKLDNARSSTTPHRREALYQRCRRSPLHRRHRPRLDERHLSLRNRHAALEFVMVLQWTGLPEPPQEAGKRAFQAKKEPRSIAPGPRMVASPGFEPRQTDPESVVLPLHNEAASRSRS